MLYNRDHITVIIRFSQIWYLLGEGSTVLETLLLHSETIVEIHMEISPFEMYDN